MRIASPPRLAAASLLASLLAAAPRPLRAQLIPVDSAGALSAEGPDTATRRVTGRIVTPGDPHEMRPIVGAWVTLHRVGADHAGPLDSVRTNARGAYDFRYRPSGRSDAIYFVSAMYAGIAYFSAPLRRPVVSGDDAEITVFDTTSAPVPIHVRGRHVVVSAASAGRERQVIEVYELANDSSVTRVAPDTGTTFTALVPPNATGFVVGQGDVPPDAVAYANGRARVLAPFAPGIKQLAFAYTLPADAFPLSIPVRDTTNVLEVMIEEPTGRAEGPGLVEQNPAVVEGRTFKRWLAADVPGAAVIRIDLPPPPFGKRALYVMVVAIVLGAAMLGALARAFWRRPAAQPVRRYVPPTAEELKAADDPDALAREIASLDEDLERQGAVSEAARRAYRARRDELKRRLAAALAGRTGVR